MKIVGILAAALAGLCIVAPAEAATLYTFSQGGFTDGGTVTGTFLGADLDNDGLIVSFGGEITDFTASYSGGSSVSPFTVDFSNLFGLVYDTGAGPSLGNDFEGISAGGQAGYVTGNGPGFNCDGIDVCGQVSFGGNVATTTQLAQVGSGPEPQTWAMLIAGFGVAGGALRRRRRARRTALAA